MAFTRTLIHRLFNISKVSNPALTNCCISSSSSALRAPRRPDPDKVAANPVDDAVSRRFLQRRPFYQSAVASPELRSLPTGEKLLEKLRGMGIARDRLHLDGIMPPALRSESPEGKLTAQDARKLLRLSQLETVKARLRQVQKNCITYAEFIGICVEGCSHHELGIETARMLDQCGHVIVLGNNVFVRPEEVVKAIQGLLPVPRALPNDPSLKELEGMELQKAAIDKKAESLVRRELWCGLGYLVIQTAAFMRLTFWELSWDVMEPICFYVTSIYFMACYAFFLRTSREPSFEGFFQSRFNSKQRRLMKLHDFDVQRYNELRKACHLHSTLREKDLFTPSSESDSGAFQHHRT